MNKFVEVTGPVWAYVILTFWYIFICHFKIFLQRPRARTRNNFTSPLSQGAKPFLPASRVDQTLADNFSALNLSSPASGQVSICLFVFID